ncbi:MAG: O-acetylhomoserine aminocarboxypropyltransferase/cysteine synthase [Alphaproteobacteria bacterium]|nr:O-acetylhomoserine aminocarboxypropyltransferase/cysteine synthase [Alphaproteobacteria bacterium]
MSKEWRLETKAIQEGYKPKNSEPRVLPIVQSTTYKYNNSEHMAKLFDLEVEGHMYSRISNPTVDAFEKKIASMEGGVGALALSSGQAAITISILNICIAGQHIVAASNLYGGTYALFTNTLTKMGIEVSFVDPAASEEEIKAVFKDNTRVLFAESIGNPGVNVLDFKKFVKVSREMQVPFIIDNTFPSPYLCRPIEHGANIVVHSATKYIDGHATSVGGIIVDGGNFDWNNGKYPELVEPDPSYHGLSYTESFGEAAYIVKARMQWLRDLGACLSPMNAFLMHKGLETLHLRMERHSENALKVAEYLEQHDKVAWVKYPGLANHATHELARKYLPKGCSGVLTFGIKGGREACTRFQDSLKLIALVIHVGDVRSCVLHPASTTHRQLTDEQQIACGVQPDMVRLSIGIENIDDLLEDIEQALNV